MRFHRLVVRRPSSHPGFSVFDGMDPTRRKPGDARETDWNGLGDRIEGYRGDDAYRDGGDTRLEDDCQCGADRNPRDCGHNRRRQRVAEQPAMAQLPVGPNAEREHANDPDKQCGEVDPGNIVAQLMGIDPLVPGEPPLGLPYRTHDCCRSHNREAESRL